MSNTPPTLILASQSAYRRELLSRLCEDFQACPAGIDETPLSGENPAELAARLAAGKAGKIARDHPDALIVGSDQVAALGDRLLGKPGTPAKAAAQLADCSGNAVVFYTAVSVLCLNSGFSAAHTDITRVRFRQLTAAEIDAYLKLDEPWDCAGSFKSEAHGSLLFEAIENTDPTGLIGLPLIWLGNCLREAGLDPLLNRG
ncbi:MAG: septum formation protein Maf [Gammaproteobacteria bacterium]|nr:septum formation protein Maf [Gammaproteobacteria bacterium]